MIKYIDFNAIDEYGVHVTPINDKDMPLVKLANNYSSGIMEIINTFKRKPEHYYVVINALGSYEIWGPNRNGDAFPRKGLSHHSIRSDMGTENDYGYKTFEYYAKLFKHHLNKISRGHQPYGDVIYSHWNPRIERVELIVGVDREKGADIVEACEKGEPISVSMGCFTDPNYPILVKEKGYIKIKDVVVGDLVWTHKNRWKKVKELRRRKYTGKLYKIHYRGLSLPMELTADHPMMGKFFQKKTKGNDQSYLTPDQFEKKEFEWFDAEKIEESDHIQYIFPEYSKSEYCEIDSIELAKIMGYYLAEGSFGYNDGKPSHIQLNCNLDDDLPREIPKIVNNVFPLVTCKIKPRENSITGLCVSIFCTELAVFLDKMIGRGSKTKFISPEIFVSSKDIKLAFIASWFNGGGWMDNKGAHISSSNINVILQARDLLASIKIPSSIYKITHSEGGGFNFHETIEYTLNISHMDAEEFLPYASRKLSDLNNILNERVKNGCSSIRFNNDDTLSYSIKKIEEIDAIDVDVYNFEVEEDESYSAAGLVSHNCKIRYDICNICDKQSKTTNEYCHHLKNYMGKIVTPDLAERWSKETGKVILPGTIVFAWNHWPRFFDISKVWVGAEPVSYVLGKVASTATVIPSAAIGETSGVTDEMIDKLSILGKQGEIDKEIGSADQSDPDGKVIEKGKAQALKRVVYDNLTKTIESEERIPNSVLDPLAKGVDLRDLFSTMFGFGIHPKPVEFQRIVLIKLDRPDLADFMDSNHYVFDKDQDVEPVDIDISENRFNNIAAKALAPYIEKRSMFPDCLESRMKQTLEKRAQSRENYWENEFKIVTPKNVLLGLAALFAGLKLKAMGIGPQQMMSAISKRPWIGTMLGGGLAYKLLMQDKQKELNRILRPAREFEDLPTTFFSGIPFEKTSSAAGHVALGALAGLALLPASYLVNAYNQRSLYKTGKELFPGAGKSPKQIATAGGAGVALTSYLADQLKGLSPKLKSLTKVMR